MSTKNSIQVGIKARPMLQKERFMSSWKIFENSIQLADSPSEPFYFDHIFNEEASNQVIFEKMAKPIVHSSLQGFNGTIFAYGQTSSGKTYTMMGDEENPGVMVLAAKEIFKEIEKMADRQFLLRIGYIEIYNEKICDLLNKKNQDLRIHETAMGMVNVNCEEHIITSEEQLLDYLRMGSKGRTVGETNMNERSSRSHAIFRIVIEWRKVDNEDVSVTLSVLNLVDLAGSERADQTGARGARLKEGGHINKSLLFLSNVIKQLSENEDDKYISYRDSKLTRILQDSLGGNALTSIICTIKPSAVDETYSTLNFAMRAKTIKNKPKVNESVSDATMMKRLEGEIRELKMRLAEERSRNQSKIMVGQLEHRINSESLKIVSSKSLHNVRSQGGPRRRTWCHMGDTPQLAHSQLMLPLPVAEGLPSGSILRPSPLGPILTPLITMRPPPPVSAAPFSAPMPVTPEPPDDAEFMPGVLCDFERSPVASALPESRRRTETLTPVATANPRANVAILEHELLELTELTNLERSLNVNYDLYGSLKLKVETLTERNLELEKQYIDHVECKTELELTKGELSAQEKRCNDLQSQLSVWQAQTATAKTQLANYEAELKQLKETIAHMELENREAVAIEFEFERQRNKAKQRETELLDALSEKDIALVKLEKTLTTWREERVQKSQRDGLMRSPCAQERSNGDGSDMTAPESCAGCEQSSGVNQAQLETIAAMQAEYADLQHRYEQLQVEYEQLGQTMQTERADLQSNNDALQLEIGALRKHAEHLQAELLDGAASKRLLDEEACELRAELGRTKASREQLLTQYDAVQREYDDLSSQLMDNITEGETLRERQTQMETKLQQLECIEAEKQALEAENRRLMQELSAAHRPDGAEELVVSVLSPSLRSSGVGMECSADDQLVVVDSTQTIALPAERLAVELTTTGEAVATPILPPIDSTVAELQASMAQLSAQNKCLCDERQTLVESTARTIAEMREQIARLSGELFEKSTFLERCSCEEYQQRIALLESERVELTTAAKARGESHAEEIQTMRTTAEQLQAGLDGRMAELKVLQARCADCETKLQQMEEESVQLRSCGERMRAQLEEQATKFKHETESLQLELLDKLELSEAEYRENMRKYNHEWEEGRVKYESELTELRQRLQAEQSESVQLQDHAENMERFKSACERLLTLNDQLVLEKNELAEEHVHCATKLAVLEDKLSAVHTEGQRKLSEGQETLEQQQKAIHEQREVLDRTMGLLKDTLQAECNKTENLYKQLEEERVIAAEKGHVLREKLNKLTDELDAAKAEAKVCEELKAHCEKLEQELADKVQHNTDLEATLATNVQTVSNAEIKAEAQAAAIAALTNQLEQTQADCAAALARQQDLQKQLSAAEEQLSAAQEMLKLQCQAVQTQIAEVMSRGLEAKREAGDEKRLSVVKEEAQDEQLKTLQQQGEVLKFSTEQLKNLLQAERDKTQIAIEEFQRARTAATEKEQVLREKVESLAEELAEAKECVRACEYLQKESATLRADLLHMTQHSDYLAKRIESLETQLTAAEQKAEESEQLCTGQSVESDELTQQLSAAIAAKNQMQTDNEQLRQRLAAELQRNTDLEATLAATVQTTSSNAEAQEAANAELTVQLKKARAESAAAVAHQALIERKLSSAEERAAATQQTLQRHCQEVQTQLNEIELKYDSLQRTNADLVEAKSQLAKRLMSSQCDACAALRAQLEELRESKLELVQRLAAVVKQVDEVEKDGMHKLKASIEGFATEKASLEAKICVLEETVQRYASELSQQSARKADSTNTSIDSSTTTSPRSRRSIERVFGENLCLKSTNTALFEDKVSNIQQKMVQIDSNDRKTRRLSTHDERRRQSYWAATRDVNIMTDPTDTNCNCIELDQKLRESERQLFIRESQVNTLNLELKNHPLRGENATLIRRLQHEQQNHRNELSKYRREFALQKRETALTAEAAAAAVLANAAPSSKSKHHVEVQTDADLDRALQKLQGKYNDLKNICRSRFTIIRALEERVAHKENVDSNVNASDASAQLAVLKVKCETLESELAGMKHKYEEAKRLITRRQEELRRLRAEADQLS